MQTSRVRIRWIGRLLVFTAVCAHLFAGPVFLEEWLRRFVREASLQSDRDLASAALTRLHAGQIEAAQRAVEQLAPHAVTPELRNFTPIRVGELAPAGGARPMRPLGSLLESLNRSAVADLTGAQLPVLRWIEDFSGGFISIRRVQYDYTKYFTAQHRIGMEDPRRALEGLRPDMAGHLSFLLGLPSDKVIAVVHAREDDLLVANLRTQATREGKIVVSYLDCVRRFGAYCPESFIGAVAQHAGTTVYFDTQNALYSEVTQMEAQSVDRARRGQPAMILISNADIQQAKRVGGNAMHAVVVTVADPNQQ